MEKETKRMLSTVAKARTRKKTLDSRIAMFTKERDALRQFVELASSLRRTGKTGQSDDGGIFFVRSYSLGTETDRTGARYVRKYSTFSFVPGFTTTVFFSIAPEHIGAFDDCATHACAKCRKEVMVVADVTDSSDQVEGRHETTDFYAVCFPCKRATLFGRSGSGRRYRFEAVR